MSKLIMLLQGLSSMMYRSSKGFKMYSCCARPFYFDFTFMKTFTSTAHVHAHVQKQTSKFTGLDHKLSNGI